MDVNDRQRHIASTSRFLRLALFILLSLQFCSAIDVVIGIDGGTESIRACCFNAHSGHILGKSFAVPYKTSHPKAGWAEQNPEEWYDSLVGAVRCAVESLEDPEFITYTIRALCCDTTCCSVVALSKEYTPLRPCLLWMDARSAEQAKQIMEMATASSSSTSILDTFPELCVNSNGEGPISAEWLLPKAMWLKQVEPNTWEQAHVICEYQDYLNYRLTNKMVASSCNAAVRWHHDGWEMMKEGKRQEQQRQKHAGRPIKLYQALNMMDLAEKLPKLTFAMGEIIGGLSEEAGNDLGLPVGTLVVQGGPDAFVGMIGLGIIHPNQLCLITGSSHLHCLITPRATSASGIWGAYRGAPLPHLNFAEGGQSSTGSLLRWVRDLISPSAENINFEKITYQSLDEEASKITPGCDGLVALETWQGSRTPYTDPLARGALVGLTLSHTRAHIFRAILESVCYGTRCCFEALEAAAHQCLSSDDVPTGTLAEVVIAGGVTRSPFWLQLHADITGRTFILNENPDGPLLGCAVLASLGAGIYDSVENAVAKMVRHERKIEPREEVTKIYDQLYRDVYLKVRPSVSNIFHALARVRDSNAFMSRMKEDHVGYNTCQDNICQGKINDDLSLKEPNIERVNDSHKTIAKAIISPSILAADWSDMKGEIQRCLDADLTRIHVDVFDGVFLDSPHALTFGPQMVKAIYQRFLNSSKELTLDIHLCVDRPLRYAKPMADAGARRIIFQWEALNCDDPLNSAIKLAKTIVGLGVKCGISINPETQLHDIYPLLQTGLIDVVDILAVDPGFGGQSFNPIALQKISELRQWRDSNSDGKGPPLQIMVDGGINASTSKSVITRGADILVVGTALFQHPHGFSAATEELP